MSEAIQKYVFANANEVRVVMRNNEPWFVAKDVCEILGTRTDTVRQIVGNKRVMSINPNTIGDNGRGHGKDILIIIKAGLHRCTGGVAFHKEADCRMLKICVSDLKSAGWDFTKLSKVKKNTLYVYFITRQGVAQI